MYCGKCVWRALRVCVCVWACMCVVCVCVCVRGAARFLVRPVCPMRAFVGKR